MSESKPKTAVQRIEDLETSLVGLYSVNNNMVRDLMLLKDALSLMGKKVDAIVQAINQGGEITDQLLSDIMIQKNVDEMKKVVEGAVSDGRLSSGDTVGDASYLVVEQSSPEGKVLNPRLQFGLNVVSDVVKEKLKGSKAGDVLDLGDSLQTKILEVYTITPPKDDSEESESQEAAPESAPAPEATPSA